MAIIAPFSIPGGLAGLSRGLEGGWPAVEQRAHHVVDLLAKASRQRTEPAVLLVQLLARVAVERSAFEPVPAELPPLLLRALSAVLGVEKHAERVLFLAAAMSNADAIERLVSTNAPLGDGGRRVLPPCRPLGHSNWPTGTRKVAGGERRGGGSL